MIFVMSKALVFIKFNTSVSRGETFESILKFIFGFNLTPAHYRVTSVFSPIQPSIKYSYKI